LIQGYNNYSDYNLTSVALQEEDLYLTQSIYNDQGFYDNYLCRVNNNTDMPFGSPGILVGRLPNLTTPASSSATAIYTWR
jgi:hypothetical protein